MMQPNVTVLIIEDSDNDYDLFRSALRQIEEGTYDLIRARGVQEALPILSQRSVDIVVLDISLPGSDWLENIEKIQQHTDNVPLLVLTPTGDRAQGIRAVKSGAQDYIVKDTINSGMISRCIRYSIERTRAELADRERRSLRDAVAAMEHVLGVVGHELRTPLATLRVTSELLLDPTLPKDQNDPMLRLLHSEIVRMADLVNNMLEAARLNRGRAKWNWTGFQLYHVIHNACEFVRSLVDEQHVRLDLTIEPQELSMNGDEAAVRRLVINLVNNAARFTSEGFIRVAARELVKPTGRWIEICVEDSGEGMNEQTIEQLGQPFKLNKGLIGPDYTSGSGLGLAICRAIVAAHDGEIRVDSAIGRGSRFTILLRADMDGPCALNKRAKIIRGAAA